MTFKALPRLAACLVSCAVVSSAAAPSVHAQTPPAKAAVKPALVAPVLVDISDEALQAENIHTATAVEGSLPRHTDAPAYVAADERRIVRIRPVGDGRVVSVAVVPGQVVSKGQPLLAYENFTLRDETFQNSSDEASLRAARAEERNARQLYDRGQQLKGGALSVGEVERREEAWRAARALVQEREADARRASEHVRRYSSGMEKVEGGQSIVVSPIDGVVSHVSVVSGQDMTAGGPPPIEVDDLSHVWVVSQVNDVDARSVLVGNRQHTWIVEGEPPLVSRVDAVEGSVDPGTQHVLVRSLLDNPANRLKPGMLVHTRLFFHDEVKGMIVPEAAVQTLNGQPVVFVRVAPGRYAVRPVETGPSLDGNIVLLRGVKAGETVVTQGSFVLKSQVVLSTQSGAE
ncbi:MAG: efflux RND transporter periplasmic adaptor subunit [Acetobacter papayae]|uniref:efflux RND transporter periplasmic adaptor subunit n=1 Tax=Acetobacter papayae TaxID=1076592 RepID=UPI0039EAA8F7